MIFPIITMSENMTWKYKLINVVLLQYNKREPSQKFEYNTNDR